MMMVGFDRQSISRLTGNQGLRPCALRSTRPVLSRFDAWPPIGRVSSKVDFVGRPAFKRRVRTMFVVPVGVRENLAAEFVTAQRDEDSSSIFILDRSDQTFNDGDAAVFADGAIARRLDAFAFDPPPERVAVEDAVPVTDDIFWGRVGVTYRPSQESAYGATVRAVGRDANAHDAA